LWQCLRQPDPGGRDRSRARPRSGERTTRVIPPATYGDQVAVPSGPEHCSAGQRSILNIRLRRAMYSSFGGMPPPHMQCHGGWWPRMRRTAAGSRVLVRGWVTPSDAECISGFCDHPGPAAYHHAIRTLPVTPAAHRACDPARGAIAAHPLVAARAEAAVSADPRQSACSRRRPACALHLHVPTDYGRNARRWRSALSPGCGRALRLAIAGRCPCRALPRT